MKEGFRNMTGASVARALAWPYSRLPLGFHHVMGQALSWFMSEVLLYRRDVVLTNLSRSFPDKKYSEITSLARDFYRHLGRIASEAVWFGSCKGYKGARRLQQSGLARITNAALLDSLYGSRSVLMMCGHNGNWELLGGFFNFRGDSAPWHVKPEDCAVVYKRLKSRFWDDFMARNRCAPLSDTLFDSYLESGEILRYALSHRNERKVYIFPTDQYPYSGSARCQVGEFLHQETKAMTGPASLASRLGMAVVYTRWRTTPEGTHEVTFETIAEDASGMDPQDIMKQYYKLLEEDIVAEPWNYLWSHKRWK